MTPEGEVVEAPATNSKRTCEYCGQDSPLSCSYCSYCGKLFAPNLPATAARGPLVLTTPAVLKERLDTYSECRKILLAWIDANLVPDVDYHLIHQKIGPRGNKKECPKKDDRLSKGCSECHAKASLSKAGSEKITGMLRVTPRFRKDTEVYEMLGSLPGAVCLVCELHDEHGAIVSEGRGARHKDQEYGDLNKTIKMAEKSAQTDATLRYGGLSELFSQDQEDVKKGEKVKAKAEKEAKAAAKAPPPPDPNVPLITEHQVADIDTLLREIGRSEAQLMKWVGYGARLEDLRAADYTRVMEEIEARRGK